MEASSLETEPPMSAMVFGDDVIAAIDTIGASQTMEDCVSKKRRRSYCWRVCFLMNEGRNRSEVWPSMESSLEAARGKKKRMLLGLKNGVEKLFATTKYYLFVILFFCLERKEKVPQRPVRKRIVFSTSRSLYVWYYHTYYRILCCVYSYYFLFF